MHKVKATLILPFLLAILLSGCGSKLPNLTLQDVNAIFLTGACAGPACQPSHRLNLQDPIDRHTAQYLLNDFNSSRKVHSDQNVPTMNGGSPSELEIDLKNGNRIQIQLVGKQDFFIFQSHHQILRATSPSLSAWMKQAFINMNHRNDQQLLNDADKEVHYHILRPSYLPNHMALQQISIGGNAPDNAKPSSQAVEMTYSNGKAGFILVEQPGAMKKAKDASKVKPSNALTLRYSHNERQFESRLQWQKGKMTGILLTNTSSSISNEQELLRIAASLK